MHSEDDDAESESENESSRPSRRVVRALSAPGAEPFDRLLYRIEGALDVGAFLAGVGELLTHHDGWEPAGFDPADEVAAPFRQAPRERCFADLVTCQHVDATTEADFLRYADELAAWDARSPRDRRGGAPFRLRLLRHCDELHVFTVAFSCMRVDVSVRIAFDEELWQHYDARVGGGVMARTTQPEPAGYRTERTMALPANPAVAPVHRPSAGGSSALEIRFRLSGEPLRRMREAARRSAANEFVWSQCAFADAVFAYCPTDAVAIWVAADAMPVGPPGGQDASALCLPLVIERAESPAQLVQAVTRSWLSLLRPRTESCRLVLAAANDAASRPGPGGTLRAAYINHAQEQLGRTAGRPAAHPGAYAYAPSGRREASGVHMLVQSWTEHLGVTLTFNTSWIAESSARSLARSIEHSLGTWTGFADEQAPLRAAGPAPRTGG